MAAVPYRTITGFAFGFVVLLFSDYFFIQVRITFVWIYRGLISWKQSSVFGMFELIIFILIINYSINDLDDLALYASSSR